MEAAPPVPVLSTPFPLLWLPGAAPPEDPEPLWTITLVASGTAGGTASSYDEENGGDEWRIPGFLLVVVLFEVVLVAWCFWSMSVTIVGLRGLLL